MVSGAAVAHSPFSGHARVHGKETSYNDVMIGTQPRWMGPYILYRAADSIFGKIGPTASEELFVLQLVKSKCIACHSFHTA